MRIRRSFHDPDGFVAEEDETVLRWVTSEASGRIKGILESSWGRAMIDDGLLIASEPLQSAVNGLAGEGTWYRHPRVMFPSYPHEWVPEMLGEAARITLDLNDRLIANGHVLKDASARNVLFNGVEPVFVDLTSCQARAASDPLWRARGQFERHFILPLLAYRHLGLPSSRLWASYDDGVPHETLNRAIGWKKWLNPALLRFVALPALFSRRASSGVPGAASFSNMTREVATATLCFGLNRLRSALRALLEGLPAPASSWAEYEGNAEHYSSSAAERKRAVITEWMERTKPRTVLDVGANTGTFSAIAARTGAQVIAMESDIDAARLIFRAARSGRLPIQPLAVSFSSSSPARGWGGLEMKSFDERANGHFELVLMLAVLHHIMIADGIPLEEIFSKVAGYTRRFAVFEFVAASDPKFRELQQSRGLVCAGGDEAHFQQALQRHFRIHAREEIVPGERCLYLCEKC